MPDYMDELDKILNEGKEDEAPQPEAPDLSAYDAKLAEMEARMKEMAEQNRKLTQYALGEPVQAEDYNTRIKEAIANNPLAYTKEVVDTATNKAMEQVNQKLTEQQDMLAAQQAIAEARAKYPGLNDHQEVIGLYADKVLNDIQNGTRKDITAGDYGKIIDEAVKMFNHKYGPVIQRQGHHVMSLDVGTQQNTANGRTEMSQILNLPDDKFLEVANKIQSGHQFQF